jgi:hypothetical protein
MQQGANPETSVLHAAQELQRYLSDEIAPMMAVEYFEELQPHPPEITARVIAQWVQAQHKAPSENVSTADLIFHALKKLALLSELELMQRSTAMRSLHEVSRLLINVCPADQRDGLRMRLSHLGETSTVLRARAEFLHREASIAGRRLSPSSSAAWRSSATRTRPRRRRRRGPRRSFWRRSWRLPRSSPRPTTTSRATSSA